MENPKLEEIAKQVGIVKKSIWILELV